FRFIGTPTISGTCPRVSPASGGGWVRITGEDLDTVTTVMFGNVPSHNFRPVDDGGAGGPSISTTDVDVQIPPDGGGAGRLWAINRYGAGPQSPYFLSLPAGPDLGFTCGVVA